MRAVVAVFLFAAVFVSPLAAQELRGTLQQIKDSGEIRIGFREVEPPMSFVGQSGAPVGYSIEICNAIVTELKNTLGTDLKVTYVPVTAENRFSSLNENKIDILCGSTTKTLGRREIVDFTELTFVTGASLMSMRSTSLLDFPSLNGKKVGVVSGTTTVEAIRAIIKRTQTDATIVEVATGRDGVRQLLQGSIDAFSADQVVLIGLALSSGDPNRFAIASGVFSYEPFALAVRRNDADFRLVADRAIADLYRNEQILPIFEKWMGQFATQRPPLFDALFQLGATPE
jgi:ABC-type amino acid transport substrate-binding protein